MSFLYPTFLFSLFAVLIPLIIHLFNFRLYKTVYFSNIAFLKNVKQETKSKSELKHLLILISRMLMIAALVVAFAQPYIPIAESVKMTENEIVALYIDNSFSMDAESKYGNLFEVGKNKAYEIVNSYAAGTKFLLLTNEFSLKHRHLISREQFIDYLEEIEISPQVKTISEVFEQCNKIVAESSFSADNTNLTFFILSDFQKSTCQFADFKNDSNSAVFLVPLATQKTNNLFIDSCWFDTPGRKMGVAETFFTRIVNKSDENYIDIPLKLYINDSLKAMGSFNIEANAYQTVELKFTNTESGILHGKLDISDYPVTYDNSFFFSYQVSDNIDLLIINADLDNKYFNALYSTDSIIRTTNCPFNNIKTSEFANYQAIILNKPPYLSSGLIQEIVSYIENGGTFILFPALDGEIADYNNLYSKLNSNSIEKLDTVKTRITELNLNNEVFKNSIKNISEDTKLPEIFQQFKFSKLSKAANEDIIKSQNDNAILSVVLYENGKFYSAALPFDEKYCTIAAHPIFVPLMYNIVLFSQNSRQIYNIIGVDKYVVVNTPIIPDDNNLLHIKNLAKTVDFIPQIIPAYSGTGLKLDLHENIKYSDNYILQTNGTIISGLAFNYNRIESDLNYYTNAEIKTELSNFDLDNFSILESESRFISKELQDLKQGKMYWKLFILLAIMFLAIEILLIRVFFK